MQANLQLQQAAADKINAIHNRAEAAYYKDDDSITTMGSLVGTATTGSICTQTLTNHQSEMITAPRIHDDNLSTTGSIIMESFTNLQNHVMNQDLKLNHINILLDRMAEVVLKGDKNGQSMSPKETDDAEGDNSTSGDRP